MQIALRSLLKKALGVLAVMAGILAAAGVVSSMIAEDAIAQIRAALVKNVDAPGRAPYQQMVPFAPGSFGASCPGAFPWTACVVSFPPVPAGKRLVVEHVTMMFHGFQPTFFTVGNQSTSDDFPDPFTGSHVAVMKPDFASGGNTNAGPRWFIDRPIRVYFEPGDTPKLTVGSTGIGGGPGKASIHGYLIDATN
jgi:hypothetical protein